MSGKYSSHLLPMLVSISTNNLYVRPNHQNQISFVASVKKLGISN